MSDPNVTDVGDESQVKTKRVTGKLKRDKEMNDIKFLLSTYGGRAFVWRVLSKCGLFKQSYTGDPSTTFFNEGARSVGLWLLEEVFDSDPKVYAIMQTEAVERGERK